MKRYKHSLSHYHLLTADMGNLYPIACTEVLPGDSIQQSTAMLVRVSPLVAPVMHPVHVRVHHWFVPNRLSWDGWEDFITGGPDGLGGSAGAFPVVSSGSGGFDGNTIGAYLGIPTAVPNLEFSAFPWRAYNLIWNNFYRDQDLMPEVGADNGFIQPVAWEKDYFTSARPWSQKGPEVVLPLGVTAPVRPIDYPAASVPYFRDPDGDQTALSVVGGNASVAIGSGPSTAGGNLSWHQETGLEADLSQATGATVNDVRLAFALQRYEEARARYGSRYTEYLRYLGVRSSDARLQLPEYLGGGKAVLNFSEVLQTAPGSTEGSPVPGGVGQFAGHGITGMRTARYRRFFEEHGYVLSLLSVRPRTMYQQGTPRTFLRRTKEDFWQRELEFVGQQEVWKGEIFDDNPATTRNVWGYQDRYAEYKHAHSFVSGEFRQLLDFWHYGRKFTTSPALNQSFVECVPTRRVYQEQTSQALLIMASHSIQARRPVTKSNKSRII